MGHNIYEQVDVFDAIRIVGSKNKRLQAKLLQQLETIMDRNDPRFEDARKYILDEVNGYTRSVIKTIFGDIEYMIR